MIIDTHTHFYDPTRPEGVPWPNPNDDLLYRTVMPNDYKKLAVPEGVTGTVVVEASKWVDDNQWILDLAANEPFIVGFVGNLAPNDADFEKNLNRFSGNPLFRGIRLGGGHLQALGDADFLKNIEKLAEKELTLDLLINPDALRNVPALVEHTPTMRVVINHIAGVRVDGNPPDAGWISTIQEVARYPNVYCKVSGLAEHTGQTPAPEDVAYYTPTIDVLWKAFGEDRLIYGSNWPVSERFAQYKVVQKIVNDYFSPKGDEVKAKFFWKNAKTAYQLSV
ncbi:amidohydrolase family protein [Candidatus Poribacteria bacterium]|nr:amidohydrolase family protein [Candidatus Poribacteria bacterium]